MRIAQRERKRYSGPNTFESARAFLYSACVRNARRLPPKKKEPKNTNNKKTNKFYYFSQRRGRTNLTIMCCMVHIRLMNFSGAKL